MSMKVHWSSIKVMQTRTRSPIESYDPLPSLKPEKAFSSPTLLETRLWSLKIEFIVPHMEMVTLSRLTQTEKLYLRQPLNVPISKTMIELNYIPASRATSIPVTMALPELAGAAVRELHSCFSFFLSSCSSKGSESLTWRFAEDTNLIKQKLSL